MPATWPGTEGWLKARLLSEQITCLHSKLQAGGPHREVTLAWHCDQKVRAVYHAHPEQRRRLVAEVLAAFPSCPIPSDRSPRAPPALVEIRDHGLLRHRRGLPRSHRGRLSTARRRWPLTLAKQVEPRLDPKGF